MAKNSKSSAKNQKIGTFFGKTGTKSQKVGTNNEKLGTDEEMIQLVDYSADEKLKKKYGTKETPFQVEEQSGNLGQTEYAENNNQNVYDLLNFINQTLESTIQYQKPWNDLMNQAVKFKNGLYEDTILDRLPEGQMRVMSNDLSQFADLKTTNIKSGKFKIAVKPLNREAMLPLDTLESFSDDLQSIQPSEISKIELIQSWIDMMFRKNDIEIADQMTASDLVVKGTAFTLVEFNDRASVGFDMNKTPGEVELRILDPRKVYPDPNASKLDLSDAKFVYIYDRIDIEIVKSKDGFVAIKDNFMADYNDRSMFDMNTDYDNLQRVDTLESVHQTVPYLVLYRRVWDADVKRFIVLYSEFITEPATDKVMYVMKENVILNIDEIPLAVCKNEINSSSLFSQSLVSRIVSKYIFVELLESIMANLALSSANPSLIASQRTGLSSKDLQAIQAYGDGSTALIEIDSGVPINSAIAYLQKQPSDYLVKTATYVRDQLSNDLGVSKLSQGNSGSAQTGEAMSILAANSDKVDQVLLTNFSIYKTRIARLMVKTMVANYQDDQSKIIGYNTNPNSDDIYLVADFHKDLFKGINVDFIVEGTIRTASENEKYKAQAKDIFTNQQALTKTEGQDLLISPYELIDFLDLPNKEAAMLRLSQNSEQVMELKSQLAQLYLRNYALVWDITNSVYEQISQIIMESGGNQTIPPFTPLNSLPEQLRGQVLQQVQNMFQKDPWLAQQVDWNRVYFYLNSEMVSQMVVQSLSITHMSRLEQELQMNSPQINPAEINLMQQLDQQNMKGQGTQQPNPNPQDQLIGVGSGGNQQAQQINGMRGNIQPQGASAPQPEKQQVQEQAF